MATRMFDLNIERVLESEYGYIFCSRQCGNM